MTKKVSMVGGAGDSSYFVSSANSKTFAVGEKSGYSLTLVNSGDKIRVYELVAEAPTSLTVSLDENLVVVPAGASKTISFNAAASKEGKFNFAVNIYSDSELVKRYNFLADVDNSAKSAGSSATLVLTIILAIIFVVLLVVLIVLLTRKTDNKVEEFGESYY